MSNILYKKFYLILLFSLFFLNSCGGGFKLPGGDARTTPVNADDRVAKNLAEGKGFTLNEAMKKNNRGGDFQFASSNELWRASLDIIDFIPLASANYSGGILITDWYSDGANSDTSIKISIKFLTNEIQSDALDIDIFYKTCEANNNCSIEKRESELQKELLKEILKKASLYKVARDKENFKPYEVLEAKD